MTDTEHKELERCRDLAETIWQSEGGEDVSAEIADLKDSLAYLLAAPPRNCDVGTAEEKKERFKRFCRLHPNCLGCVMKGRHFCRWECALAWMQLPYEEGEAK